MVIVVVVFVGVLDIAVAVDDNTFDQFYWESVTSVDAAAAAAEIVVLVVGRIVHEYGAAV